VIGAPLDPGVLTVPVFLNPLDAAQSPVVCVNVSSGVLSFTTRSGWMQPAGGPSARTASASQDPYLTGGGGSSKAGAPYQAPCNCFPQRRHPARIYRYPVRTVSRSIQRAAIFSADDV